MPYEDRPYFVFTVGGTVVSTVYPESILGTEVRRFVRTYHNGVLSTLSKRLSGYPFASVTPFVLDDAGNPVILISNLAEHTKNLDADPRVSLIVHPCTEDVLNAGRVTLVGRGARLADKDAFGERYLRYFPQAADYFSAHDFYFYRIQVEHIRYIGGFGKIHWVPTEQYAPPPTDALVAAETDILSHMNADHRNNLRDYCRHLRGYEALDVKMVGIDYDGFDVRADGQLMRFEVSDPIVDAASARSVLVQLAQQCRESQTALNNSVK